MTGPAEQPNSVLLARAQQGDGDAFRQMTGPYREELRIHCYRMLGSFHDAEDVVQDTLLAAWQSLSGFDGRRAGLRTWLYRIATNRCLNARRAAGRRAAEEANMPGLPEPTGLGEVLWLEPYPDARIQQGTGVHLGPEVYIEQQESVSLAFITALQALPPRQVAVLVLREVLGFHATEVAEMLDSTVDAVNSLLKRARAAMRQHRRAHAGDQPAPAPDSPAEQRVVSAFVDAYQAGDIDRLVTLFTDDVFMWMPPLPFEYEGRDAVARLCAGIFGSGRRYDLIPTRANGQPAFATYIYTPTGIRHATSLIVLSLRNDRIASITRFDSGVLPWFGLPRTLPISSK
ncbi:MAG: RNA polymerase subunit sigma-70 [Mycobacteriaceae bacterium]|nr:RNA polymerase subunit sigma-70 [Mycobacteriaceae bacterium]